MKKKSQIAIYIVFIFVAIVVVLIAAVIVPFGVRFNAEMYAAGEGILESSLNPISSIQDEEVRTALNNSVQTALDSTQDNIEVNTAIFKYSWIVVLLIAGIAAFMTTRSLVAYSGAGGGII